jgi:class 3 adenylate cyclase
MANIEEGPARRLVTDADREEAVARLRAAVVEGCLDLDEVGERIGIAYQARTADELTRITADLPDPRVKGLESQRRNLRRRSILKNPAFRSHIAVYGLTNGFLVGIWAVTGADFFWPFFPAGGWGIGLGMHALATAAYEQKRLEKSLSPSNEGRKTLASPARQPSVRAGSREPASASGRTAVLFVDIVESTHLATALGDAGWRQLRARHREDVGQALRQHGGREFSMSGDGLLGRFDDEVSAVRCAVEIHRKLSRRREESGFAPSVRTAVHAGPAVTDGDGDVLGVVVNLTCRVAAEAEPDEVLVTEAVAERLGDRFPLEDRGLRHLKGFSEPRHLLAVGWA